MKRYLQDFLDLSSNKIVVVSGARQSGKTTMSKAIFETYTYLNFDSDSDRLSILKKEWRRDFKAVIFDELHKMKNWKRWLKGIYDTEGKSPKMFVTGSANLETFRKIGDSLAGRYFSYRLHPLDIKELVQFNKMNHKKAYESVFNLSGFPEPCLSGSRQFYRRWQKTHLDVILKQDLLDLYSVNSIKSIELLTDLLKERTASPLSLRNLAMDLQVDSKTVKSWINILENLYVVFKVTPYHKNIARAILKESKYYFYDICRVESEGERLENLVAAALIKECNFIEDTEGYDVKLHYLRTKDGKEIDFLIVVDKKPVICFEVKTSDSNPSKSFPHFQKALNLTHCVQLVLNLEKEFDTESGVSVRNLTKFLATFDLKKYI